MNAEPNDPACALIHHDQDPVRPQRCRLTPEQIYAPEAVFHMAQESQPRRTTGARSRQAVLSENPPYHVFVDLKVERQCDLLGESRTAPVGITLLHLDDHMDEFCARSSRAGLPTTFRGE